MCFRKFARLTGSGSYAPSTLKTLESRLSSAIELPDGESVTCGDGARITYLDRARDALEAMNRLKAMPRMVPQPEESTRRSPLRSRTAIEPASLLREA